jgi:type II secretory pathway pseudopilin PulG
MPTGEPARGPRHLRHRGIGYFGLLALLAVLGAGLAQLGTAWSTQAQRQREAELRFRGEQIRDAIARYRAARNPAEWPPSLQALLDDRREGLPGAPRHHLRQLWVDPFTGRADWVLLPPPGSAAGSGTGIGGVRSRADSPRLARGDTPPRERDTPRVSDWEFVAAAAAARTGRTP